MGLVTEENWGEFTNWAARQMVISFDTETTGLRPFHGDRLVGISVGAGETTWYLPFRHEVGPNLPLNRLSEVIRWFNLIHHPNGSLRQMIGHNTKFDLHMLAREGFEIPDHYPRTNDCPILDTLLGAHLVNENERVSGIKGSGFGLKYLCDKYGIGQGSKDEQDLKAVIEANFRSQLTVARKSGAELKSKDADGVWKGFMWKLPADMVAPYAETDAFLTWGLFTDHVFPRLQRQGLFSLFHEICNYNLLITDMEEWGIYVNSDTLDELLEKAEKAAKAASDKLWWETGIENSNSPPQCSRYFGIKSTKEMELKYAVMEGRVREDHANLLLDARGKRKVIESYLVPYTRYLADDSAIHAGFKIHGTATGRLSCSDPNLTALPRDVRDQPAKRVFQAREGFILAEIDLSQAELRVASHFAALIAQNIPDPATKDRYLDPFEPQYSRMGAVLARPDSDLHTETLERMKVYMGDRVDRDLAKRINLSAIFGIGAHKFSQTYAVPFNQSKEALGVWRGIYPEFSLLYSVTEEVAKTQDYITLPMSGRMRRYTNEGDNWPSKASSNLVQGTVADVMRMSMHEVAYFLRSIGGRILLQVHDSLLLEIPDTESAHSTVTQVQRIMTEPFGFLPSLRSEAKIGHSWGDMKVRETRHDSLDQVPR